VRLLPGTRKGRTLLVVGILVLLAAAVAVVLLVDFDKKVGPNDARRKAAAVTEADNGRTVTVAPGKPFIVDLKGSEDAPWGLPQSVNESLAIVSSSQDLDGSSAATFLPQERTPAAIVTAERIVPCATGGDPCPATTERFEVTIRVEG
jgi:hypothetical protein